VYRRGQRTVAATVARVLAALRSSARTSHAAARRVEARVDAADGSVARLRAEARGTGEGPAGASHRATADAVALARTFQQRFGDARLCAPQQQHSPAPQQQHSPAPLFRIWAAIRADAAWRAAAAAKVAPTICALSLPPPVPPRPPSPLSLALSFLPASP
jgi:hypothetical protein